MACNPLWVLCVTAPKFCSSEHLHTHLTLNCSVTFLCVSLHTVRAVVWGQNMQWAIFTGQLSAAVLEEEGESPRVCTWHVCNTPWALDTESQSQHSLVPGSFLEGNMQNGLIHPHRDHQFAYSMSGRRSGLRTFGMVGDTPLTMSQGVPGQEITY